MGESVTQAQCASKHPAREPWPTRVRTWLQIIVLVGAIRAGYLAFHGVEASLDGLTKVAPVQGAVQGPDGG